MAFQRVKDNFELVAKYGDAVPLYLFSDLFLRAPALREMFPLTMSNQRARLMTALAFAVEHAGDLPEITPYLHRLGRSHRKYGAEPEHYALWSAAAVGAMRRFSGPVWSSDLERDWRDFLAEVTTVLLEGAELDSATRPPYWRAEVISHERRAIDTAVVRVLIDRPYPYVPGQSAPVEVERLPNTWRYFSMANVPRQDNTVEFHVKAGGVVAQSIVRHLQEGDTIKLGAPVGTLTLNPATGRNLLLVAGGTGLSPIKAILEHVTRLPVPPWVSLFWGAREPAGLYDLAALRGWASRYSWLTVIPALSDVPDQDLATAGTVSEIMRRYGRWDGYEAYVCGPPAMVGDVVGTLRGSGFNDTRIHLEQFASTVAPPQRFTS